MRPLLMPKLSVHQIAFLFLAQNTYFARMTVRSAVHPRQTHQMCAVVKTMFAGHFVVALGPNVMVKDNANI